MKKLNILVIKSFLGPFVLTFFISLFILLMQFIWKYIDDLVGKGLEWYVIAELLTYASATMVPLALPLAMLLSSIMTFGSLGEHYELVATKSAGVSLLRFMAPLIVTSGLICVGAFYFSNNLLPITNLKAGSLLYDVRQQKPALSIREGVFYNGIDGYVIKVGRKDPDGKTMYDLMIYDHTDGIGNNKSYIAESGTMQMSDDERYLVVTLMNGHSYEDVYRPRKENGGRPLIRTQFKEEKIRFDLSAFKLSRTNEDLFKDHHQMLNISQLQHTEDTLTQILVERKESFAKNIDSYFRVPPQELLTLPPASAPIANINLSALTESERSTILQSAMNIARSVKSYISSTNDDIDYRTKVIIRHQIEYHRKFTLSFAVFVLFFVGAPLGALIRKGGLGMPVVVAMFFFIFYHIMSITGEKFAREGVISPLEGMWAATIILLPLGIFLTYKANTDSKLLDKDSYTSWFKKLKKLFPQKSTKTIAP